MEYQNGHSTADKFTYTITNNGGLAGATIEGSTLKIPSGVNVKEGGYTLQIKAHEKMMEQKGIAPLSSYSPDDYCVAYEETEALVEKGLVKRIDKTDSDDNQQC